MATTTISPSREPTTRRARCSFFGRPPAKGYRASTDCRAVVAERQAPNANGGPRVCLCEEESSEKLAFFTAKPDQEHDEYYCGCHGWD